MLHVLISNVRGGVSVQTALTAKEVVVGYAPEGSNSDAHFSKKADEDLKPPEPPKQVPPPRPPRPVCRILALPDHHSTVITLLCSAVLGCARLCSAVLGCVGVLVQGLMKRIRRKSVELVPMLGASDKEDFQAALAEAEDSADQTFGGFSFTGDTAEVDSVSLAQVYLRLPHPPRRCAVHSLAVTVAVLDPGAKRF